MDNNNVELSGEFWIWRLVRLETLHLILFLCHPQLFLQILDKPCHVDRVLVTFIHKLPPGLRHKIHKRRKMSKIKNLFWFSVKRFWFCNLSFCWHFSKCHLGGWSCYKYFPKTFTVEYNSKVIGKLATFLSQEILIFEILFRAAKLKKFSHLTYFSFDMLYCSLACIKRYKKNNGTHLSRFKHLAFCWKTGERKEERKKHGTVLLAARYPENIWS